MNNQNAFQKCHFLVENGVIKTHPLLVWSLLLNGKCMFLEAVYELLLIYLDVFSDWLLCVSVRWGRRSSRSGCWGSGWTAVLRRAGFWWPCRRALGGGTTHLSLKWWRSGWTVTGSLPLVQLCLMERRKRKTKMSEEHLTLQHDPLAFPTIYGNT